MCGSSFLAAAQIIDVFQQTEYEFSTLVLSAEIDRDYAPGTVEILQDINDDKNANWQAVEDQLKALAISSIENNVTFIQMQTRAIQHEKQVDKLKRIENTYLECFLGLLH